MTFYYVCDCARVVSECVLVSLLMSAESSFWGLSLQLGGPTVSFS